MDRRTNAQTPALLSDSRGAIMVMGLFFCSILVGGLWYLAGLGDAMLYRERAQEAADAVAFTAAAVHARGMNILVMINLIMAVILSIRVALKALLLLEIVAEVVFAVACLDPFGGEALCAAAEPDGDAIGLTQDAINVTREPINSALKSLADVEKTITKVIPPAAIAASYEVGRKYDPAIKLTVAVPQPPLETTLPVVPGTANYLCMEAGDVVGQVVKDVLDKVAPPLAPFNAAIGWLLDRVGAMAKSAPQFFCEIPGGTPPKPPSDLKEAVTKKCSLLASQQATGAPYNTGQTTDAQNNADITKYTKNGQFDQAACVKDQMNTTTSKFNDAASGGDAADWANMLPAAPDPNYGNGCPIADTLGISTRDDKAIARDPKLVDIGHFSSQSTSASITSAIGAIQGATPDGFAQAEFFYDCHGQWDKGDCNPGPDYQDAMWHFKWRPRLVFFNNTNSLFQSAADALSRAYETQLQLDQATTGVGVKRNAALRSELESVSSDSSKVFVH